MYTENDDPFASASGAAASGKKPCGCGEASQLSASENAEIPSLEDFQAELDALSGDGQTSVAEFELEAAVLEDDLELADLGTAEQADLISLGDLVALADHYPGLKITLSF